MMNESCIPLVIESPKMHVVPVIVNIQNIFLAMWSIVHDFNSEGLQVNSLIQAQRLYYVLPGKY